MNEETRARLPRWIFLTTAATIVVSVLWLARAVLLPVVFALVLAYVLTPAVAWFEKRRLPRGLAIVTVYAIVLGSMYLFVRLSAPRLAGELVGFRRELPKLAMRAQNEWLPSVHERLRAMGLQPPEIKDDKPEEPAAFVVKPRPDDSYAVEIGSGVRVVPQRAGGFIVEPVKNDDDHFDPNRAMSEMVGKSFAYAEKNAIEIAKIGRDIVAGVSRVVFIFGITLMLCAYLMLTRERVVGFFESLFRPQVRPSWRLFLWRADRGLSGVVRGQLIICLVNGALSAIGFAIVGLKFWPLLAIVATVLSLIPIFGSILSSVPAVAIGLTQSVGTGAFVLVWIIGVHQLEANFLNPKIMGDSAKIHPVLVVVSLLVGEHFFHAVGALLAVPCMSLAQSLFIHLRSVVQARDPDFTTEPSPSMPPRSISRGA